MTELRDMFEPLATIIFPFVIGFYLAREDKMTPSQYTRRRALLLALKQQPKRSKAKAVKQQLRRLEK